jgi:hypothetical protein
VVSGVRGVEGRDVDVVFHLSCPYPQLILIARTVTCRFFTQKENLRAIADKLNRDFLRGEDVYVDFSCGTNEFGAMLQVKHFIGFDIFPPSHYSCRDHFR